jgi:hypothetical protein
MTQMYLWDYAEALVLAGQGYLSNISTEIPSQRYEVTNVNVHSFEYLRQKWVSSLVNQREDI